MGSKTGSQNIAIGVDLGTTNSSIAVNINGKIEIIKKPGGVEYTPSVFGFDKSCNKVVGQKAYDQLYKFYSKDNADNFRAEIKRVMGTPETVYFERAKTKMSPEEISAEILKNLKEDVLHKYPDFDTTAVVITVPAAFSVLQSEATKRAGNLAGFKHVVLLQEPIAAAISYGFMNDKEGNWIIYDLGGGTFDIALISCKEGVLSVLGHNGDNFKGGKDIDWSIVEHVIKPKLLEKYKFANFNRNNPKYKPIFSRLKYIAESSKIELSQYKNVTMEIDEIGKDDAGKEISISIPLSRIEFDNLIKPIIDRTIELAKTTIKEAGIKSSSIKKIVLVGGPTLMPYLKERLEEDLGIAVDSSVDPLTVVARGACIFGISQKIPKEFQDEGTKASKRGEHSINLNYVTLTSDTEESVTGIIEGLNEKEQYYVKIQSDSGTFTGPKTKINKGKFYYTVDVERNKQNLYWIYLFDEKGNPVKVSPDSFIITHGLSVSGAPLNHSIQVVVAGRDFITNQMKNKCEKVFEKGEILPLKKTLDIYKTARKLKKGEKSELNVSIVHGEEENPDRNTFLCNLGFAGKDIPNDLPEGTPVELTVEANESGEVFVTAHIPLIDITVPARGTIKDEKLEINDMTTELESQKKRAASVSQNCSTEESKKISDSIQSVSESLNNSGTDEDEKRKANKQLKDLKISLDRLEEEKKVPQLINEYNARVTDLQKLINEYADPKQKDENTKQLERIKADAQDAIQQNDKLMLIRINEQLENLRIRALFSNPNTHITVFRQVAAMGNFINEQEAKYYIDKGTRAIQTGDIEEVKRCTKELVQRLPKEDQRKVNISGITR